MMILETIHFHSIEELEAQLIDFKIFFAYHSNKIENNQIDYHDTREIFEKGRIVNYTGDLQTLYEISNQKDCYRFLLPKIIKKEPLSIELIKAIHFQLSKGTYDEYRYEINHERPGEFKKHDYVTGVHEVGSYPEDIENDLSEVIAEVNSYQGDDYLTVASYLHAMFENIHPFADANGRVGRTILNYYLLIHHIKPLIIYENDRKLYYEYLEKFDMDSRLEPLVEFLTYEQKKTWHRQSSISKKSLDELIK